MVIQNDNLVSGMKSVSETETSLRGGMMRSPFEQIARQAAFRPQTTSGYAAWLAEDAKDEEILRELAVRPIDFMDSPLFHQPDGEELINSAASTVPKPAIDWYQPLMYQLTISEGRVTTNGSIVPLTREQERALFRLFNFARFRIRAIQTELGVSKTTAGRRSPSPEQAAEIIARYRIAQRIRNQIAHSNLALVISMARRTLLRNVEFADLISEGNMALMRSIDKFNADLGNKFSTYACQSILKAFGRLGLKDSKRRELFPVEFEPELERPDLTGGRREELVRDCATQVGEIVRDNRCGLTDVEQTVIKYRFGLLSSDPEADALTLGQVGELIGVGKERVRQIQVKALAKIRQELEQNFLLRREGGSPAREQLLEVLDVSIRAPLTELPDE